MWVSSVARRGLTRLNGGSGQVARCGATIDKLTCQARPVASTLVVSHKKQSTFVASHSAQVALVKPTAILFLS